MASKGSRVTGTDGSDFEHRETVAGRYKSSIAFKAKLRWGIFAHVALYLIMTMKMFNDFLDRFDILIPAVAELAIPKPLPWEYVWMASLLPSLFGLASLNRNRNVFLHIFIYGTILLGIFPILGGMVSWSTALLNYYHDHRTKDRFMGQPTVVLWFIFFACALEVHGYCLYCALNLRKAWDKTFKTN